MKKLALLLLPLLVAGPAFAGGPRVRHRQAYYEEHCYKNVEKYIPGYYDDFGNYRRGRVKVTRKQVPCRVHYDYPTYINPHGVEIDGYTGKPVRGKVDDNSCAEGTVAGGLLGGALGGVLSKKENWIWAIPSGMVGGAMIGCQIDGG